MFYRPTLNNQVSVKVLSNKEISRFYAQVFAKGEMLVSEEVTGAEAKEHIFTFTPKFPMIPTANVLIYYIASNGEIISDNVEVEFGNELRNHVSGNFLQIFYFQFLF